MYTKHFSARRTSQSQPIPGSDQVPNSAGGYAWAVDDWTRLDRFLVLGSEGGSYYATERQLTVENAEAVLKCIDSNGTRVVQRVVEVSEGGRAPKNNPALFVLAMCAGLGDDPTRKAALTALPRVARIGTHIFTFLSYVESFRGWGRGLRSAVASWYNNKNENSLAYQVVKYRQRLGWTHRDALRLSHPVPPTPAHNAIYRWVCQGTIDESLPRLIRDFLRIQDASSPHEAIHLIKENSSITWEMLPSELLRDPGVWRALLPNLPMTALLRNLARMTANGALKPLSPEVRLVCSRLTDQERLRKARVHPISILGALTTYRQGRGARGRLEWDPITEVVDVLDEAFYLSFGNVEPTSRRLVLALDVSGSMDWDTISGMPGLTPRVASAALALVTASVEPNYCIVAFSGEMIPINISPRQRLDDVVQHVRGLLAGSTDCALPMIWALERGIEVDAFIIYTDSETWVGGIHPSQALAEYRRKTGIPARMVVVGMVSNGFSIADPNDPGMLDVVGFDTATPSLISDFARGSVLRPGEQLRKK